MRPMFVCSTVLTAVMFTAAGVAQTSTPSSSPALPAAPPMPAVGAQAVSITPPAGAQLLMTARGDGVQIYTCTQDQGSWAWKLKAPEATLFDAEGKTIGRHGAGPTWQLDDGSAIKGTLMASQPQVTAIPWLLLSAQSTGSAGRLEHAGFVQRTETVGGRAPSTGCDAANAQGETRVPYSAKYSFYSSNK